MSREEVVKKVGQNWLVVEAVAVSTGETLAALNDQQLSELNAAGHRGAMKVSRHATSIVNIFESLIDEVHKLDQRLGIK